MSRNVSASSIRVAPRRLALAQRTLVALGGAVVVATVTGVLSYCYPGTLGAYRGGLIWLHNVSGDLSVLLSGVYLVLHLPRVWGMRSHRLSRWSGYVALAIWIVAALTGVYGQLAPMPPGSVLWLIHLISSLAAIIIAAFHGVWGFRPKPR